MMWNTQPGEEDDTRRSKYGDGRSPVFRWKFQGAVCAALRAAQAPFPGVRPVWRAG